MNKLNNNLYNKKNLFFNFVSTVISNGSVTYFFEKINSFFSFYSDKINSIDIDLKNQIRYINSDNTFYFLEKKVICSFIFYNYIIKNKTFILDNNKLVIINSNYSNYTNNKIFLILNYYTKLIFNNIFFNF